MAGTEELAESKKPIILAVVVSRLAGPCPPGPARRFSPDKPNHSAEPLTGVELALSKNPRDGAHLHLHKCTFTIFGGS